MQMGFGYADDNTPVPLGRGACAYYFNSRCHGLGVNPELRTRTNPVFTRTPKPRQSDANAERVEKTPRSNLSKQIREEDEFLNTGDKI